MIDPEFDDCGLKRSITAPAVSSDAIPVVLHKAVAEVSRRGKL